MISVFCEKINAQIFVTIYLHVVSAVCSTFFTMEFLLGAISVTQGICYSILRPGVVYLSPGLPKKEEKSSLSLKTGATAASKVGLASGLSEGLLKRLDFLGSKSPKL